MRLRSLAALFAFTMSGPVPCVSQQPSGPATLENVLKADEVEKPAAAPEAEAPDAAPKRPAGTVARPKDGVKHADLDKAWADYEVVVARVAEDVRAVINKQFDAATAKGDLDAAEKWQKFGEKFEKTGEIPLENETKAAVSAAQNDYKKARGQLTKAYEDLVKALTMGKKIAEAKAVRDEVRSLESRGLAAAVANPEAAKPADAVRTDGKETAEAQGRNPNIPRDALRFKGQCYYLYANPLLDQSAAHHQCQQLGGQLARIESAEEWAAIEGMLTAMRARGVLGAEALIWIDGSDTAREGEWQFADGTPLTFFAWRPGEPNAGRLENGLCIKVDTSIGWNDGQQRSKMGYLCEWGEKNRPKRQSR